MRAKMIQGKVSIVLSCFSLYKIGRGRLPVLRTLKNEKWAEKCSRIPVDTHFYPI